MELWMYGDHGRQQNAKADMQKGIEDEENKGGGG